jgi:hypothetical protein
MPDGNASKMSWCYAAVNEIFFPLTTFTTVVYDFAECCRTFVNENIGAWSAHTCAKVYKFLLRLNNTSWWLIGARESRDITHYRHRHCTYSGCVWNREKPLLINIRMCFLLAETRRSTFEHGSRHVPWRTPNDCEHNPIELLIVSDWSAVGDLNGSGT